VLYRRLTREDFSPPILEVIAIAYFYLSIFPV
jgi:hypothetical protein